MGRQTCTLWGGTSQAQWCRIVNPCLLSVDWIDAFFSWLFWISPVKQLLYSLIPAKTHVSPSVAVMENVLTVTLTPSFSAQVFSVCLLSVWVSWRVWGACHPSLSGTGTVLSLSFLSLVCKASVSSKLLINKPKSFRIWFSCGDRSESFTGMRLSFLDRLESKGFQTLNV